MLTEAVEVEHNHKTIAVIDIIKVPYGSMTSWHAVDYQHAVDSLNVKHELQSKKIKQFGIMQTFPNDMPLENRVLLFAWIKAKVKELNDVTGRH